MTTLRDALEGAFEAAETGNLESVGDPPPITAEGDPPPESTESTSETTARHRDDAGRFASKAKEDDKPPVEADVAQPAAEVKPARKVPTSWKKDYWGHWEKLGSNPELAPLQDYIEQRETEFVKGVSAYRDEAMKAKALQDAVTPYMPVFQQFGVEPAQHVQSLLATHHALVTGTPEQKIAVLARAAAEYGVPLQALAGQGVDPQQMHALQELQTLRQTVGHLQMTQQQRDQMETQSQIDAFKSNAPFFAEVRETMAGLLQSGHASDLKTAYEKACRLNDDVWAKVQAEQSAQAQREAAQRAQAKKAAAVSTRSSAPTGQKVAVSGNDIRSTLEAAVDAALGGRL